MVLLALVTVSGAFSRVVRVEVESTETLLQGRSFGLTGPYQKLTGKVFFAVDPGNSANRIIADIDLAPTNSQGEVEFSSEFFLLKPLQADRGNGTVLYEVSNRGNKGMLRFFNDAQGAASLPRLNTSATASCLKRVSLCYGSAGSSTYPRNPIGCVC